MFKVVSRFFLSVSNTFQGVNSFLRLFFDLFSDFYGFRDYTLTLLYVVYWRGRFIHTTAVLNHPFEKGSNKRVCTRYYLVMTMSVDLPEGLEKEIDSEVGKGRYKSKSEFIRDAVRRLLDERDKIEHKQLSVEAQRRIDEARETDEEYSPEELKRELGIEK